MQRLVLILIFGVSTCVLAFGDQSYSGTWRLQSDHSVTLVLEQKSDALHLKEMKGGEIKTDYTCNTLGKDCQIKDEGHSATVSLWFNGPRLVEFETRGSNVTRRRFELADDGKTLNVELTPIKPEGKDEKLAFTREAVEGEQAKK